MVENRRGRVAQNHKVDEPTKLTVDLRKGRGGTGEE